MGGAITINMHFKCNAKCVFCVVGIPDKCNPAQTYMRSYNYREMVGLMEEGKEQGNDLLILSGGEPTIHPDLLRITEKAKELGYVDVQVKTNGIRLGDASFVKSMADAGVDTFCISIQGHNEELHDNLVGYPGAFRNIMKGVDVINESNKVLITPTCIQKGNYQFLPEIMRLFQQINSRHCTPTFIETNGSARENFHDIVPRYSEVVPYLKEGIRILEESGIPYHLHGFPMCIISGYENASIDLWRTKSSLAGSDIRDYNEFEKQNFRNKDMRCKECILSPLCNGPWANYVKVFGFDEFVPVKSESIVNIISMEALMNRLFVS